MSFHFTEIPHFPFLEHFTESGFCMGKENGSGACHALCFYRNELVTKTESRKTSTQHQLKISLTSAVVVHRRVKYFSHVSRVCTNSLFFFYNMKTGNANIVMV